MNDKEDYAGLIAKLRDGILVGTCDLCQADSNISVRCDRGDCEWEFNVRLEAASALTTLTQDAKRLEWLEETFKHCPHTQITFNDDPDMEDDHGEIPLGYSMRIDGCSPLKAAAPTFRELIDSAMEGKEDE